MLIISIPLFVASGIEASLVAIDADDFQRELTRIEAVALATTMISFYWIAATILFQVWRLWRRHRPSGTAGATTVAR